MPIRVPEESSLLRSFDKLFAVYIFPEESTKTETGAVPTVYVPMRFPEESSLLTSSESKFDI